MSAQTIDDALNFGPIVHRYKTVKHGSRGQNAFDSEARADKAWNPLPARSRIRHLAIVEQLEDSSGTQRVSEWVQDLLDRELNKSASLTTSLTTEEIADIEAFLYLTDAPVTIVLCTGRVIASCEDDVDAIYSDAALHLVQDDVEESGYDDFDEADDGWDSMSYAQRSMYFAQRQEFVGKSDEEDDGYRNHFRNRFGFTDSWPGEYPGDWMPTASDFWIARNGRCRGYSPQIDYVNDDEVVLERGLDGFEQFTA